jgi:glycine/D-amino acid oxidase-like deaminating enzyme
MTAYDVLIVGAGLAGTTLAWELRWRGLAVQVIDRDEPVTASKIAAGLLTPVTGKRLAPAWRYAEFLAAAEPYYRRVEQEANADLFSRRPAVRLYQSEVERVRFEKKRSAMETVRDPSPPLADSQFDQPHGGFEMTDAARIRVADYLRLSRVAFADRFQVASITAEDLRISDDEVTVPRLDLRVKFVVFCQGFWMRENPLFRGVQFVPAKGEILTLRVPGLTEDRVVNRGVWLLPLGGGLFRAGATYDRDRLDHAPTAAGRDEICSRLRAFLRLAFEVIDHVAAVRPVVDERKPVLGFLPDRPRVGVFNGLSSKGALMAPFFARQLADAIQGVGAIEPHVELRSFLGR